MLVIEHDQYFVDPVADAQIELVKSSVQHTAFFIEKIQRFLDMFLLFMYTKRVERMKAFYVRVILKTLLSIQGQTFL